jgi:RNA polymerase sigma factor (sigma-70 family)
MESTPFVAGSRSQIDYDLVCKAREQGDERAYTTLMKRYRDNVYLMMLRMTGDAMEAEDLTMIAFSKAFRSLNSYMPTNTFSTWLFKIAVRGCIDYIRKQHTSVVSLEDISERIDKDDDVYEVPFKTNDDNPEESIIREQRYNALRGVIDQLKPYYRELVELRYFENMSYDEIAKKTGLPLGTVKIRLFRAHDILYALIKNKI